MTYREHRIRGSLDRFNGQRLASESELRALAAAALDSGVILFLRKDLEKIPWQARELIESEARRLYGRKPR